MATPLLKYLITTPSTGAVSTITDTSSGTALNLTCTTAAHWQNGTPPTLPSTGRYYLTFIYDGTNYDGFFGTTGAWT